MGLEGILKVRDMLKHNVVWRNGVHVWQGASSGLYTVKEGYQCLKGVSSNVPWWKSCWHPDVFPRHGFVIWLLGRQVAN